MASAPQTGEALSGYDSKNTKFLLLFTAITVDLSLQQWDGNSRRMYARAYLSDLHSFSFVVRRTGSETSGVCSLTLSSNLAFPARIWSTIVRSDKSQLWSRSASIIRV